MTPSDDEISVRSVTLRDVPAICAVHRGSDGPWVAPVECAIFANHRLLRPFHCCVAERGGQVVGHAEWIVDREPGVPAPRLYLGMLQVRGDCQRQGVGRRLIEYGAELAVRTGCDRLRTVPEERTLGFYAGCGFSPVTPVSRA
jgi:GNAT superfamily N-acetyltransferase